MIYANMDIRNPKFSSIVNQLSFLGLRVVIGYKKLKLREGRNIGKTRSKEIQSKEIFTLYFVVNFFI